MGYNDPAGWIDPNDQLLSHVEDKVKSEKLARPKTGRSVRSFLPPSYLELDIVVKATRELMRLAEWVDVRGRVFVDLVHEDNTLRKGHFNHDWHHNPNGRDISPPHHIHFPTLRYPNLDRMPTYAYPVKANSDYLNVLRKFCDDANIAIQGVPLPLLRR